MRNLSEKLAQELSEQNPEFKKIWEEGALEREISAQLINIRLSLGMTQQKFADYIGMKQSFISRLENGEQNITVATLQDIANGDDDNVQADNSFEDPTALEKSFYVNKIHPKEWIF